MRTLEESLAYLQRFGRPVLGVYSNGWHCQCDIYTAHAGATVVVKSEFGHTTPNDAADECVQRLEAIRT